jgi:hypothetical protein
VRGPRGVYPRCKLGVAGRCVSVEWQPLVVELIEKREAMLAARSAAQPVSSFSRSASPRSNTSVGTVRARPPRVPTGPMMAIERPCTVTSTLSPSCSTRRITALALCRSSLIPTRSMRPSCAAK